MESNFPSSLKIQIIGNALSGKSHLAHLLYHLLSALNYDITVIDDERCDATDSIKNSKGFSFEHGHLSQKLLIEVHEGLFNIPNKNDLL